MLGLLAPTDPSWLEAVEGDLDRLLRDHAHCELKAAQSALSLVARYAGEHPEFVAPLVALAHEETEHFAAVQAKLAARGARMSLPDTDGYVAALRKETSRDHGVVPPLMDRLLVSALVEARSCERFKVLADGLASADLRAFYRDLMASEARHFRLFSRLSEDLFGERETRLRLESLSQREAGIARQLPLGPTVHG